MELVVCQLGTQGLLGAVRFRLGVRQLTVDGLVVAKDRRRLGVGSLLLRLIDRIARRANVAEVVVDAVTNRVSFYARASFGSAPSGIMAEHPPLFRRLDRLLRRL
jgi:GNAT superfamily N-acetyltransferase